MKKSLILILILGLLLASGFFLFRFFPKAQKPTLKEESIKLEKEKIENLKKLKHPGKPISLTEEKFGREDPFAPY